MKTEEQKPSEEDIYLSKSETEAGFFKLNNHSSVVQMSYLFKREIYCGFCWQPRGNIKFKFVATNRLPHGFRVIVLWKVRKSYHYRIIQIFQFF